MEKTHIRIKIPSYRYLYQLSCVIPPTEWTRVHDPVHVYALVEACNKVSTPVSCHEYDLVSKPQPFTGESSVGFTLRRLSGSAAFDLLPFCPQFLLHFLSSLFIMVHRNIHFQFYFVLRGSRHPDLTFPPLISGLKKPVLFNPTQVNFFLDIFGF